MLGAEELRALKGFQYTATLLDLERLRFVGACCLRLLRVYVCEIYPVSGVPTPPSDTPIHFPGDLKCFRCVCEPWLFTAVYRW